MTKTHWAWAVLADETRAKLLHCGPSPNGSPHVDQIDTFETTWEGHQHGRPSPLKAKNGHTHAAPGHEKEEARRRFAQELANWLDKQIARHDIDHLAIFGPSRFLSALRGACLENSLTAFMNIKAN